MILQKVAMAIKTYIAPLNTTTTSTQNNSLREKQGNPHDLLNKKKEEDNQETPSENKKNNPTTTTPLIGPESQSSTLNSTPETNQPHSFKNQATFSFFHLFQNLIKKQKSSGKSYTSSSQNQNQGSGIKKGAIIDHKIK